MALEDYKKKRDFSKTPEPAGEERAAGGSSYCIQKHAASRLHYDFRLELDGVLLSWAVPKGPSFDPKDKRLATRVEDHPVEYGSFEGVIPEREYGAGAVVLWDRGTWEPVIEPHLALKKGELKFMLHGEKLGGKWVLVKIKGDDKAWLLIKEKDEHARVADEFDIVSARPESVLSGRGLAEVAAERDRLWHSKSVGAGGEVNPGGPVAGEGGTPLCLADLAGAVRGPLPRTQPLALSMVVDAPPDGDEWLHEIKHDGYRIVARIEEGDVRLVSRNGKDWTKEFPQVARAVGRLPAGTALLDGEVAAVLPNGATSFQALQRRGSDPVAPLVYFVFDLLHLDGWDLREVRLEERKEVLRRLLESAPATLRFSDHVRGQGREFFEKARQAGLEGVVSKRAAAPYRAGRGGDWRKAKCRLSQEFVIGGFTLSSDGGGSIGALLVGFFEDGQLVYAGKVGSGLNDRLLADLKHRLEARRRKTSPFAEVPAGLRGGAQWVEPDLVAQVEFSEWTDEGRMRQPVFLGLRDDREAGHVVRERPGTVEGGGVDTVAAGRPWEALRRHATRTHAASGEEVVELLGVRLTHPDRVYYPDLGFTKVDLALYYVSIADAVLPHLDGRPLTLLRCPDGIGGETFYQKHPGFWTPPQVRRLAVPKETEEYLFVDSVPGLVALAQAGILEIHPWNSRVSRLEQPDQVIFDLDPDETLPFSRVAAAARRVRAFLGEHELESFVKTTGGKGLHVCVPLEPAQGWAELEEFTRAVAVRLSRDEPGTFTANMAKTHRKGKVFVDYLRNVRSANAVGAYSTRAREGAPVSAPVEWDELDRLSGPKDFTVAEAPLRVLAFGSGKTRDPWARYRDLKQRVPASLTRALAG
ncbi:MAG TPA: DNA ligase D, partial [Vicinamibacteria bacterium]|nr:DNA ligase D [Vicinamibacteria bacterium]